MTLLSVSGTDALIVFPGTAYISTAAYCSSQRPALLKELRREKTEAWNLPKRRATRPTSRITVSMKPVGLVRLPRLPQNGVFGKYDPLQS